VHPARLQDLLHVVADVIGGYTGGRFRVEEQPDGDLCWLFDHPAPRA